MGQIVCKNLECKRGGFTLKVERLSIAKGEKIALLGENGCGKTTLLHMLAGLLPFDGTIEYQGKRWDKFRPQERAGHMSFLPQEAGVLFNLTVQELIALNLSERPPAGANEREAVLEATAMKDFLNRAYHSLSGGEKRRAMLARIFCRGTDFVFLDEPTGPLDLRHSAQFMRYVCASAPGVVAAMHDINLAVKNFERFLLMKHGRILFDRKKKELKADELETVYGIELKDCGDHFMPVL